MRDIVFPVAGVTLALGAASLASQEDHSAIRGDELRLGRQQRVFQ